jgi:hypothetical protein
MRRSSPQPFDSSVGQQDGKTVAHGVSPRPMIFSDLDIWGSWRDSKTAWHA